METWMAGEREEYISELGGGGDAKVAVTNNGLGVGAQLVSAFIVNMFYHANNGEGPPNLIGGN